MISYKEKLKEIKYFIFDVDGVLTDGKMYLINGEFVRALNSKDAYALQYAIKCGYQIFIITGGKSQDLKDAMGILGVTEVHMLSHDKIKVYNSLKEKYNFTDNQVLYMGDDFNDLPIMSIAGLKSCPQDAVPEIKEICDYQSPINGGEGCVRDVIKQTLKVQGHWNNPELAYKW